VADTIFGYDFFISYSHADGGAYPTALKGRLTDLGFTVFLDRSDYVAGLDLRRETKIQVGKSKKLVVVGREGAFRSKWVLREVQHALDRNKIPILININAAAEVASASAPLSKLALECHWLRIDESLAHPDDLPTDKAVAELGRSFRSTRQQTKRQRWLAATAITLGVLAAIAIWQWRTAEASLEAAVSTGDEVVHDLVQNLRQQDGIREEAIFEILQRASSLSDRLSEFAPNRTDLLRNRGAALSEMAKTYLHFGASESALNDANRAEQIYSRLADGRSSSNETRLNLARARILLGDVRLERNEISSAFALYNDALVSFPDTEVNDQSNRVRAQAYERLGDTLIALSKFDEARAALNKCIILRRTSSSTIGEREADEIGLSICIEKVGDSYSAEKTLNSAIDTYAESREVLVSLMNAGDGNAEIRKGIATSFHKSGDAYRELGNLNAAQENYLKDYEAITSILSEDPDRADRRHDLLLSLERLGNVSVDLKKDVEAQSFFERAVEISDWLRSRDPRRRNWIDEAIRLRHKEIVAIALRDRPACLRLSEERLSIGRLSGSLRIPGFDLVVLINDVAWYALLARSPERALAAAQEAVTMAPERLETILNQAHALMLLGSIDQAKQLYYSQRQKTFHLQGTTRLWEDAVLDDFVSLREAGLNDPLMSGIEADFRKSKKQN
jgi:tetratricopeptide (TPR) repeat protein